MGIFSALQNVTNGYSPMESLVFDRLAKIMGGPLHDYAMTELAAIVQPGMRVLDVGCGGGHLAIRLAERFPELRIVGVDLSPEQIGRAQARTASLRDRLTFLEANAIDLPFADLEFDLVYSLGSIKHWTEQARGLHECARVLRPGGRLWVIEGDRGCHPRDVRTLISAWNVPAPLDRLAASFFRNVVAGYSLDVDEARSLLATIDTIEGSVERGPGLPIWLIEATRVAPRD